MTRDTEPTSAAWYLGVQPASVSAWIVRMHWARAAVDLLVLLGALLIFGADLPLRRAAPLVAAAALIRADLAFRLGRGQHPSGVIAGVAIVAILELPLSSPTSGPA